MSLAYNNHPLIIIHSSQVQGTAGNILICQGEKAAEEAVEERIRGAERGANPLQAEIKNQLSVQRSNENLKKIKHFQKTLKVCEVFTHLGEKWQTHNIYDKSPHGTAMETNSSPLHLLCHHDIPQNTR